MMLMPELANGDLRCGGGLCCVHTVRQSRATLMLLAPQVGSETEQGQQGPPSGEAPNQDMSDQSTHRELGFRKGNSTQGVGNNSDTESNSTTTMQVRPERAGGILPPLGLTSRVAF